VELITVTSWTTHEVNYFAHLCGVHPHKFRPCIFEYLADDHRREAVELLSELNNKVLKEQPKVGVVVTHEANE
jgi:hypothetical protein